MPQDSWDYYKGALCGFAAASIWASWSAMTRFAVTTSFDPWDVALLRFGLAGLLLTPVVVRRGFALDRLGWFGLIVLIAGAGAPYALVAASALRLAPAAELSALNPGCVPLFVALMTLRGLPARLAGRRSALALDVAILDQFLAGGFCVLADSERELVLGAVGRFWKLGGGIRRIAPEQFPAFAEPGFAKVAFNLHAQPTATGARLSTETRIQATDAAARRAFSRYWMLIRPGSAAIRRGWLRAIKRHAEMPAVR